MRKTIQQIKCSVHDFIENICKKLDIDLLKSACFKGKSVYGPVRSDRFGYSLCINTIKCKACSYNCIYCQAGQITNLSVFRNSCISAYELFCVIKKKLELLSIQNIPVDYIIFTPQGEPTLDDHLAQKIMLIREFGLKIAVITNASLLWNHRIQEDLLLADYISIKIDTVNEDTWEIINRPHPKLRFELVLDGIRQFSKKFKGILATETMIIKNINDNIEQIEEIGEFLKSIQRKISYFTIPSRPPIHPMGIPPDEHVLTHLSKTITNLIPSSSISFTYPEEEFYGAGALEDELFAVLSGQPMKEESVEKFILSRGGNKNILEAMIANKSVSRISYNGALFLTIPT